jgi:glycosyltransferase involved in cell wall biosynthesis
VKITLVAGFLLPIPPARGGAMEKTWSRLAEKFAAAGHEVTFVSRRWPGWPDRETIAGVRHRRLRGADHTRHLTLNLLLDFLWGLRVTRALPPADVVITNTVALPVWLHRLKPSAGRVVAVIARMPKGQTRFYSRVDRLLSLSRAVTARIVAENPALGPRIVPFPLPIDWALHAASAARSTPLTIGYIGRLHPEKGIALLLAAAARLAVRTDLPPWRLVLLGPVAIPGGGGGETWLNDLRARYDAALGQHLILLPPEFDPALLARQYGALDIFCYPSLAEQGETFGVAVAEAMAAGCVPVVSALACFHELVHDGDTGVVFDHAAPTAATALADVFARLLTDAPLRRRLALRAQAHTRQFDFDEVSRTLLRELNTLANTSSKPTLVTR